MRNKNRAAEVFFLYAVAFSVLFLMAVFDKAHGDTIEDVLAWQGY